MQDQVATPADQKASAWDRPGPTVRHFRQIVLWPLQLICGNAAARRKGHDNLVSELAPGTWQLVEDEIGNAEAALHERHYREFVTFLPHVQRFLYGDGSGPTRGLGRAEAPLRVYRRRDVAHVRITLDAGATPIVCEVSHIDLYFFHEVDAVLLAFELAADDLPLAAAQDIIYKFGRAYPSGWSETGEAIHCPALVEWLDKDGKVLTQSNYGDRDAFLSFVGGRRSPRVASHWVQLLQPIVPYAENAKAPLQFRQIEYYRMPVMAYLVLDDLHDLTPADHVRLAFATGAGDRTTMPFAEGYLKDFETRHCYDRYFYQGKDRPVGVQTRFLTCGHALIVLAGGTSPFLMDGERGLLGQFRHQLFLLFMIAHFHKAALLMLSDRLVAATKLLDPGQSAGLQRFREETFDLQEKFLMFTQRYYFNEVSDQALARDIFHMLRNELRTDALYGEVRGELLDLVQYLDSTMLRRQSGSMHRLTAVTTLGLIGTTATGFLGMNLIAAAEIPLQDKIYWFSITVAVFTALTISTVVASAKLTTLFDRLTGER